MPAKPEREPLLAGSASRGYGAGSGFEVGAPAPSDAVAAVAVVHFHPIKGNLVEWSAPAGFGTDGIEFKCIPSGMHTQREDYILFRHRRLYGLACFHRLDTEDQAERSVRMRALACFSASLDVLRAMRAELTARAAEVNASLDFEPLRELIAAPRPPLASMPKTMQTRDLDLPTDCVAAPSGAPAPDAVAEVVGGLGAQLFVLWRAMRLRRRVIFCAPPPVGPLCESAALVHAMVPEGASRVAPSGVPPPELLLFVGVSALDDLAAARSRGFIACTTERMIEEQEKARVQCGRARALPSPRRRPFLPWQVWDVFVTPTHVRIGSHGAVAVAPTPADRGRHALLVQQLWGAAGPPARSRPAADVVRDVSTWRRFFSALNASVDDGIDALHAEGARTVTEDELPRLGLAGAPRAARVVPPRAPAICVIRAWSECVSARGRVGPRVRARPPEAARRRHAHAPQPALPLRRAAMLVLRD